ncbi:MAG: acyltransferase [Verrucomicrobia bacterium]|nr:acyltransferase [Verrucomicrobiota bacterium]
MSGLTGLRGLAALTVFIAHSNYAALIPGLQPVSQFFEWHALAVDFFFMLSGFVLIHVYADLQGMKARGGWRRYAVARVARIVPLYLITLVSTLLIYCGASLLLKKWPSLLDAPTIVTNFLLLQNWPGFFHNSINTASWSLSVESLCYLLLLPLCLAVTWHRRLPHGAAAVLVLALLGGRAMLADEIVGWGSLGRGVLCFLAGVLLHRFHLFPHGRGIAVAAVFGAVSFVVLRSWAAWGGLSAAWLLLSFPFLLIGLASSTDTWANRFFSSRTMLWLGDISYSLYLWQGPVLLIVGYKIRPILPFHSAPLLALWILLEITFMLWLATLSYKRIELPLRNWLRERLDPAQV